MKRAHLLLFSDDIESIEHVHFSQGEPTNEGAIFSRYDIYPALIVRKINREWKLPWWVRARIIYRFERNRGKKIGTSYSNSRYTSKITYTNTINAVILCAYKYYDNDFRIFLQYRYEGVKIFLFSVYIPTRILQTLKQYCYDLCVLSFLHFLFEFKIIVREK